MDPLKPYILFHEVGKIVQKMWVGGFVMGDHKRINEPNSREDSRFDARENLKKKIFFFFFRKFHICILCIA